MTFIGGPRREHEAIAANAIRWRRIENGEPTAAYVLDQWHKCRRLGIIYGKTALLRRHLKVV